MMIQVENVSKVYKLYPDRARGSLKESLKYAVTHVVKKSSASDFWALKDVSFSVEKGEILGISGANGSGKSTLFKILSRITAPTAGEIRLNGKLRALLEVNAGFHTELTGRENVYISCAIHGLSQQETGAVFDAIHAFSEIGDFIDIPIKFYSSGMAMRLGFAVACHVNADILLLDEVWAVGDYDFQQKSLAKMRTLMQSGMTVLMITHDATLVQEFCTRTLHLEKGQLVL